MDSKKIRQQYLDYFAEREHVIVPSAPLVIKNDPTLMFTNAGMNQFKDYFLGNKPAPFKRAADTQKCLRVSGKHNDLEDVGLDTYHHTMFEMLGNWSFGDYFKKDAITWSFDLLINQYKLPFEDLYATVFGGDETEGLARDEESFELWKQFLPEERILFGSKKDNFWEMGEQGPCGASSELHFDLRADKDRGLPGKDLVNNDHPQVIEIWNNVFIEFNRLASGELINLPDRHVDTGMGYERLCRAVQGKHSNYDSDLFAPLLAKVQSLSGKAYGLDEKTDIAFRVIVDHIRAIALAITDGQLPSNNKAGYVIRRILRRAVRYGYSFLGFRKPFLYEIVPVLAEQFTGVFDDLRLQQDFVGKVVYEEEASFLRTLDSGIRLFEGLAQGASGPQIEGAKAFELYDTFGFPLDLTNLLAREAGLQVDEVGFEAEMQKQKDRSRQSSAVSYGDWQEVSTGQSNTFVGYDSLQADTVISRIRSFSTKGEQYLQVVLATNPFYAESGGQVGDRGLLISTQNPEIAIQVLDTRKENDLAYCVVAAEFEAYLKQPQNWIAAVDEDLHTATSSNHTATHLLHAALRQTLGHHVEQKGSLVSDQELRFDFSHPSKISRPELDQISELINEKIRAGIILDERRFVPIKEAKDMGANALFGEKYGEYVRVITFDPDFSIELCGGTHVKDTATIGLFRLEAESSVAAGVRRITALTGRAAHQSYKEDAESLERIGQLLRVSNEPENAIANLISENERLRRQIKDLEDASLSGLQAKIKDSGQLVSSYTMYLAQENLSPEAAKNLVFELAKFNPASVSVLGTIYEDKPLISLNIGKTLQEAGKLDARQLLKLAAGHIKGGGGGQAFYATAGGKNAAGIPAALQAIEKEIKQLLA